MADAVFNFVGKDSFATANAAASLDVVYVHGLTGDPVSTWSATSDPDSYWPRWLATDIPNLNVWAAGYDSSPFIDALSGVGASMSERATILLDFMLAKGLGKHPTVFVVHSLGGVILKQMLRVCADSSNPKHKSLLSSIRGIIFCGTPHEGSAVATSICSIVKVLASKTLKELSLSNETLLDLNTWFRNWVSQSHSSVCAYHEVKKTKGFMIVPKQSADPGIAGCVCTAIDADHINMCKPSTRDLQLYLAAKEFIKGLGPLPAGKHSANPYLLSAPPANLALPATGRTFITAADLDAFSSIVANPQLLPDEKIDPPKPELLVDYEYYTTQAPHDRRPISEKLEAAGRAYEVKDAQRKKERFAMALRRHGAQASSLVRLTRLMSDVETRFNRHVWPEISAGATTATVNDLVQQTIIDAIVASQLAETDDITSSLVERALFYLTGNCHVRWDPDQD